MKRIKFIIFLISLVTSARLSAQDSIFKLKGQVDGFTGLIFSTPVQVQTGARFLTTLSIGPDS